MPKNSCATDAQSVNADGVLTDCAPYHCGTTGKCKTVCASVDDCVSTNVCSATGACVAGTDAEASGCNASGGAAPSEFGVLVMLVAVAFRRRGSASKRQRGRRK